MILNLESSDMLTLATDARIPRRIFDFFKSFPGWKQEARCSEAIKVRSRKRLVPVYT
jgi:hypothetical protein